MHPVTKRMKPRKAEKLVRLSNVALQLSSVVLSDTEPVSSMEDFLDFGLISLQKCLHHCWLILCYCFADLRSPAESVRVWGKQGAVFRWLNRQRELQPGARAGVRHTTVHRALWTINIKHTSLPHWHKHVISYESKAWADLNYLVRYSSFVTLTRTPACTRIVKRNMLLCWCGNTCMYEM